MIIRESVENDYKAIWDISKNALGYDCDIEAVYKNLNSILSSDREMIFVAENEDVVVGYIHAEIYSSLLFDKHLINILAFAVAQGRQHCGTGAMLLNKVEEWAKEISAVGIRLNSGSARADAHKFYRTKGFNQEKQQIRFVKIFISEE